MKLETLELNSGCKITVLELDKESALKLAQDLIGQVNGPFIQGHEFKIEDNYYFKVAVNRVQDHIKEAIEYLSKALPNLSEDEKDITISALASGDNNYIWQRYLSVKLKIDRENLSHAG